MEKQRHFQKVMPHASEGSLRKQARNLRRSINAPIIDQDAQSRELKLPTQKLYKDLTNIEGCIEATIGLIFSIELKLQTAEAALTNKKARHKERYKREPDKALSSPHNYVMSRPVSDLKARLRVQKALLSELQGAYRQLARRDYTPKRSNFNVGPR